LFWACEAFILMTARKTAPLLFLCLLVCAHYSARTGFASEPANVDASISAAVCPIVYPDDQTPAERGYHYTFFGNAFFINDQGYLLTAAHVLETFRDGGQPYIIMGRKNAPPRILKVLVIAVDARHDVAILRATPNPFESKLNVTALPLSSEAATRGESVLAVSLHPARLHDAHSFELPRQDISAGQVISFETTQLEKSAPPAEVFLLSHPVVLGQSGSPVIATESHAVVGLIEGRWLRSGSALLAVQPTSATQPNNVPGAAVPIRYAIELLKLHNIPFESHPAGTASDSAK
jgi:S1-C subfamily serine protease